MHPDIEKLINIAKESGELTDKQKEIILRKAEKLGEDIDEVEMYLESHFSIKSSIVSANKKPKMRICPVCGARVPSNAVQCPECGSVMEQESDISVKNRDYLGEIQRKLDEIDRRKYSGQDKFEIRDKREAAKLQVIQSFSVPMTKDALIMAFNYAKSQFDSRNNGFEENFEKQLAESWLAKAKEFYSNLASMSDSDDSLIAWLKSNASILETKKKNLLWLTYTAIILANFGVVFFLCKFIFKIF